MRLHIGLELLPCDKFNALIVVDSWKTLIDVLRDIQGITQIYHAPEPEVYILPDGLKVVATDVSVTTKFFPGFSNFALIINNRKLAFQFSERTYREVCENIKRLDTAFYLNMEKG